MRVIGVIVRIIFHMPRQSIHQCSMIVSMSRMHHQARRLIYYHQVFIFVNDIKRNIFGNYLILITRTIHHDRYHVKWLHLIAALYRFSVNHHKPVSSSFLNTVTRSINNTFKQILIDSHQSLPLVYYHPKVFIKLSIGFLANRFYIINISFNIVRQFLYHTVRSLFYNK